MTIDAVPAEDYALDAEILGTLCSPTLIVHLEKVRENLRRMKAILGGDLERWRVHVKTSKIPEVWAELVRFGVRNFKCATLREARELLRTLRKQGADVAGADLLVAYPHVEPSLGALAALAAEHREIRVSVLVEDPEIASRLPESLGAFIDLNPGMNRTGLPLEAKEEMLELARLLGPRLRGLHFYEGHVHSGSYAVRRDQAEALYPRLLAAVDTLHQDGHVIGEVVTSGTPSFRAALESPTLARLEGVRHRVSPGTIVYHDLRTDETCDELDFVPAAVVFSRVISHPASDLVTCDAGSKALAAEAGDPCAYALGHPELEGRTPNEEHLPFRIASGERPRRGTPMMLVPRHVCPTVNLAEQAVLVEDGKVAHIVSVAARAHDVLAAE